MNSLVPIPSPTQHRNLNLLSLRISSIQNIGKFYEISALVQEAARTGVGPATDADGRPRQRRVVNRLHGRRALSRPPLLYAESRKRRRQRSPGYCHRNVDPRRSCHRLGHVARPPRGDSRRQRSRISITGLPGLVPGQREKRSLDSPGTLIVVGSRTQKNST